MTRPGHPASDPPPYTGTLTPEHLAVARAERDRWLRIGLSTCPADRPAAEAAVRRACAAAGLQPPGVMLWMDSPWGGCLAVATLCRLPGQLDDQLRRQVEGQLERQLWERLANQLPAQVWDELGDEVDDRLGSRLWEQLVDQLPAQPWEQLGAQLYGQPGNQLGRQLQDRLGGRLREQLVNQLEERLWEQLGAQLYGQLGNPLRHQLQGQLDDELSGQLEDHGWTRLDPWEAACVLAVVRCAVRIAGLRPSPRLEALADAVAHLGWWWPLRGAAILTDRPTRIARDQQGRLHAEHGPALAWADGYTLHAIHGVRVPAHLVEAPETITVDQIRSEENQEVQRVMLDRYGHQRFLREAGAEQVHIDETGILWHCAIPGEEDLVLVQVSNATPEPDGSARTYWLRVPPQMRTARQAVAWTFNLDEGDYHPAVQT
jgi:hypothetical protein